MIAELVGWLPADQLQLRRQVVDRVIDQASRWTTGQLRARLRKLILAIDPHAAKTTYRAAVKARRVEMFDNPDAPASCGDATCHRRTPPPRGSG